MRTFHPYYPDDPNDVAAAARVRYIANDWFLNAVVKGNWDNDFTDFDGNYTGAERRARPTPRSRAAPTTWA